jgi:malonyl-CoA O-methyltransferase
MLEHLKQVKIRFNKASKSYDDVASVQRDSAEFLVCKLLKHQKFTPQTILDCGSGTGYITELLLKEFPKSSFYLNDIACEMLETCKAKFAKTTNIYYLLSDMMKLDTYLYDYVISNLALQWAPDLQYAIRFLHSKSSDIFAFSTLLDGTFEEWQNLINKYQTVQIKNYPKAEGLINLCNIIKRHNQIFEFWIMDFPLSFDSPKAFMSYLQLLGASASENLVHLSSLKKLLKEQHNNLIVTYKVFFGIFRREIL